MIASGAKATPRNAKGGDVACARQQCPNVAVGEAGQAVKLVENRCKLVQEDWGWECSSPAGIQTSLVKDLNRLPQSATEVNSTSLKV